MDNTTVCTYEIGTPAWHAWRRDGIGQDDICAIGGEHQCESAITVYERKAYNLDQLLWLQSQASSSLYQSHPDVVMLDSPEFSCFRNDMPWMHADIPAIAITSEGQAITTACYSTSLEGWIDESMENTIPPREAIRIAWQMAVTGIHKALITVLITDEHSGSLDVLHRTISLDPHIADLLIGMAQQFRQHVREKITPQVSLASPEKEAGALARMLGRTSDGTAVMLGPETQGLLSNLKIFRERMEDAKAHVQSIENTIKTIMGRSSVAFCEGKKVAESRLVTHETIDPERIKLLDRALANRLIKTAITREWRFF